MKRSQRNLFALAFGLLTSLSVVHTALAQRVRFDSPSADSTTAAGSALPDGSGWVGRSSNSSAPFYVASVPNSANTNTVAWSPAPPPAYGTSMSQPQYNVPGWDPYNVAARPAALSGNITSTAAGQYLVPQPMPRVPYYTQQPVVNLTQPYTIVPESGCASSVVPLSQPATVMPLAQPATVAPLSQPGAVVIPGPTPPPMISSPAVPTLIQPVAPPPPVPVYPTRWYVQADAIFFKRDSQIGNTPLVLLDNNASTQSNVLLSNDNLDFPFQVGPRILVGYEIDPFRAIEASYFGIYNWKDSATINGNNDLNLPGDLGLDLNLDFFNADTAAVTYDAIIHNAELNYVRTYGNLSCLFGFRYFHLGEKLNITFTDNQTGSSSYKINTFNNLFGGQIGARVAQACGNWSYDLTGKAGVYGNIIKVEQNVSDFSGFTVRNSNTNTGQVAFIGDVGLNGNYQFSQNWFLRGGYQVYWLEGLARAPDQIDYTLAANPTVQKTDGMFMHGPHAGLMAWW